MAAGMVTQIGGAGDTLDRLHEMVEEERTQGGGSGALAQDSMDMSEVQAQGSRADGPGRSGPGRFRRARGHLARGHRQRRAGGAHAWADRGRRSRRRDRAEMPAPQGAPAWARELALAYESRAHGQFVLYGNVHDRLPTGGRLVNLAHYIETELLTGFAVVFSYDLGNGLRRRARRGAGRARGAARRAAAADRASRCAAIELVSRYLRYLGNLRALDRGGKRQRRRHPARRRSPAAGRRRRP